MVIFMAIQPTPPPGPRTPPPEIAKGLWKPIGFPSFLAGY